MSLSHSFQGRFLIVAFALGVALLVMAVYTKKLVRDDGRQSSELITVYQQTEANIKVINDQYLKLKSTLYQYSLLLTPELKQETKNLLKKLISSVLKFEQSKIINTYPNLSRFSTELNIELQSLADHVNKILILQKSAYTRYPAVAILQDEMQPSQRHFQDQMNLVMLELDDVVGSKRVQLRDALNKISYAWARRVSEVRLFVANRSGTLGNPKDVLPKNIETEAIFAERVDMLLDQVRDITYQIDRDVVLKRTVDEMIFASSRYGAAFKRAAKLFMQPGWRQDVFVLESLIEPLLNKNMEILNLIKSELAMQMGQMVKDSVETSTLVSAYIWWFVTAVYFLLLLAYIAFEKMIRQPLFEVARALEAQGNDEHYEIPIRPYYVTESEVLIDAFSDMKEQVDSRQLRLQTILRNAGEGVVIIDRHGNIETFNPAAEKIFGVTSSVVYGQSIYVLRGDDCVVPHNKWQELWRDKADNKEAIEVMLKRANGKEYHISIKTSSMSHKGETYYISVVMDITERKVLLDKLQNQADIDSLTALHNRRYFTDELDRLVERAARRKQHSCALLFIDLDNFKFVNDSYGHHAGDRVLVEVSSLLQSIVRKSDLLARLGGDEFAVILYDVDENNAREIAEKYQLLIANFTFFEQGKILDVGCTVGVAMMDDNIKSRDEFLMHADFACQLAKQMGRNCVYMYSKEDTHDKEQMIGHMGVAQTIKDAIRNDDFALVIQPIKSVKKSKVVCYEVLLRLISENGKMIMPFGFLPSAERFNLMKDIDIWVIKNGLKQLSEYLPVDKDTVFAINLSAQSIGDFSVIRTLEDSIEKYNIPPQSLVFEITESVAISYMDKASSFLQYLRDLGCKTSLDDFGSGYSSYAYLKNLPADYVKIDGDFVRNIDEDELNLAMVRSMNEIAHVMGKETIAEYVENQAILDILERIGVDYVQGDFIGKPLDRPVNWNSGSVVPIRK